jgi:CO dehydrogenase/acetyl-CoA synthase alpha subunit
MLIQTKGSIQLESIDSLRQVSDTDGNLTEKNKGISEKIRFRHQQTNARLTEALTKDTGLNFEVLLEQLNACGECTVCMDVCPICTANKYSRDEAGQLSRETLAEWMISCAGCGMCEQDCSQHKPLSAIFGIVQEQLNLLK